MRAMKLIQLQAMKYVPSLMKQCLTQTVIVTVSQRLTLSTAFVLAKNVSNLNITVRIQDTL